MRKGKPIKIHRYIYEQCFGEIPKGYVIMHTCDTPACINPEHLKCGAQADNVHDMIRKGRANYIDKYYGPKGTSVWSNKLSEKQVLEIRNDKRSQSQIANDYGLSRGYVARVRNKKTWGWL
jgi:hypothetical protein